jgi:hypothetical protein
VVLIEVLIDGAGKPNRTFRRGRHFHYALLSAVLIWLYRT